MSVKVVNKDGVGKIVEDESLLPQLAKEGFYPEGNKVMEASVKAYKPEEKGK